MSGEKQQDARKPTRHKRFALTAATADIPTGQRISALLSTLAEQHPEVEVLAPGASTVGYAHDASPHPEHRHGPAVALPVNAGQVQQLVRAAASHGVGVVPRGAGSGLSGGASAAPDQLVISLERLRRIVEVSAGDEVAVVEPGVLTAELNMQIEPLGLFFAPDPASHTISTIGGNIATNAGGLHCAKYGVTRESVLALDVVLADGSLVSVGHRSIKGVTGLDLVSLFVGSEGILGIVVRATLRLRPIPVARRTVTAFFDSTRAGADALGAITRSPVRPAAVEFFDTPSLESIDRGNGTALRDRGAALLLIELDGYGVDEQASDLIEALSAVGGRVRVESDAVGAELWELRRGGRRPRPEAEPLWRAGGDIAVPKSRFPEVFAALPELERRFGVTIAAIAHAGDGNLHPLVSKPIPAGADPSAPAPEIHEALAEIVRLALRLGGTVSGEHGIGSLKREFAAWELSPRNLQAQHAIKAALDPGGLFNPGKAI